MEKDVVLFRVSREDIGRGKIAEVLAAFEKLGATGISIDQQVTEADEASKWTVAGDLVGSLVQALSEF